LICKRALLTINKRNAANPRKKNPLKRSAFQPAPKGGKRERGNKCRSPFRRETLTKNRTNAGKKTVQKGNFWKTR